jgi:putative spermidine/putrescine transport system ATP-binding protein
VIFSRISGAPSKGSQSGTGPASTATNRDGTHVDATAAVQLTDLRKIFGRTTAIDDLSLRVNRGAFFALLGPSGCGKTTTLRAIAGLCEVDAGIIEIMGRDVTALPVNKRNIGMVFQNYALFPHMTVAENISFGLKMRGVPKSEITTRIARALDLVQLPGIGARIPSQLSGGQQQRVAFARAIVIEPELLLLDEPMSNLDAKLRKDMRIELRSLQRRLGITAIYVTHDQEEALTLSDQIAVMKNGRIVQCAGPTEIYRNPVNRFVAEFIGRVNILRGQLIQDGGRFFLVFDGGTRLELPPNAVGVNEAALTSRLNVVLRPEDVQLQPAGNPTNGALHVRCRIVHAVYAGATTSYVLEVGSGLQLLAEQQNSLGESRRSEGDQVDVHINPKALSFVPE